MWLDKWIDVHLFKSSPLEGSYIGGLLYTFTMDIIQPSKVLTYALM